MKKALSILLSNVFDTLTIVLMILVGRYLGETDFGLLSYAQSISLVILGLGNAGLSTLAVRQIAIDPRGASFHFSIVFPWAASLTLLTLAAMIAGHFFWIGGDIRFLIVVSLIGGATLFRAITILLRSFLKGLRKFEKEALGGALEALVVVGGGAVILLLGFDLITFSIYFMFSRLLGLLIFLVILSTEIKLGARINFSKLRPIAISAAPVGCACFVFMLVLQVDVILLTSFATFGEVGEFSAAHKIYAGLLSVPAMAVTYYTPLLASHLQESKERFNAILFSAFIATLALGFGAAVVGVPLAGTAINLLYGEGYEASIPVMRVLLVACIPAFLVVFLQGYLVIIDRRGATLTFALVALAARVVLNLVLIPKIGILGVAYAVAASETIVFLAISYYLFRTHFKLLGVPDAVTKISEAASRLRRRS